MATRPASDTAPAPVPAGIFLLGALALATGWAVLLGAPLTAAIPAMGGLVILAVVLLVRRPQPRRSIAAR